ncbi:cysteine-rich receptor-like protein kinase 4 isoform X2 [Ipomoea triloba]|uniref:cysteine-rich receptor-like protein kinase 4 isoform X2 n=1 Tax=Ipomoea triloba TaxID=35885 RepID=UPI00125E90AC|nr:cysteine-rich receptor-like protein kinase 4 isoform X2 [Ipomoea triloba]
MDSLKWIGFQILRKMKGRKPKRYENSDSEEISFSEESMEYDFITIQNATNNFSKTNKIGEGGFGVVYKGTFENGQQVAVKKLYQNLKGGSQEFKNEVTLMVKFQHRNLVRLLGFSLEGKEVLLVYEFVPNGSLDNFLFDPVKRECLGWERRYKIIECIARGLVYLHEGSYIRIIHCNLKASNVLLDEDLNPKIVDFDMSKLFTSDKIHISTSRIMRTRYMAPEYALLGEISIKSDVYSFGMLILEIISGHRISSFQNGESRNDDLLSYAWTHWKDGSTSNVIDSMLKGISSPVDEITKCIHIALLCVQESVADRPKMIEVLQMLNNLSMRLPEPLDPGLFIRGSISSEASSQFTKNVKSISDQYVRKMQKKAKSYAKTVDESCSSVEISSVESHLIKYELITLQNATNNFSRENILGQGAFGVVYKGKLKNELEVAVKVLDCSRHFLEIFKNEVALLARIQHRNLVRLFGYCQEGREMILVYEFVPHGLDEFLFDRIKCGYLDWGRRYNIIEGIGKGLVYLHEDSRLRIVHRNLNASKILLDADLNPKVTNFGLAWFFALDEIEGSTDKVVGTCSYFAPEYAMNGEISVKTDVFNFGVLVLQIINGHKNDLINYSWRHWKKGSLSNVIDPMLRGISSPVPDIINCIHIALLCVQEKVKDRPTMGEVVQMLSNLSMSHPIPSVPGYYGDDNLSLDDSEVSISDDEYPR